MLRLPTIIHTNRCIQTLQIRYRSLQYFPQDRQRGAMKPSKQSFEIWKASQSIRVCGSVHTSMFFQVYVQTQNAAWNTVIGIHLNSAPRTCEYCQTMLGSSSVPSILPRLEEAMPGSELVTDYIVTEGHCNHGLVGLYQGWRYCTINLTCRQLVHSIMFISCYLKQKCTSVAEDSGQPTEVLSAWAASVCLIEIWQSCCSKPAHLVGTFTTFVCTSVRACKSMCPSIVWSVHLNIPVFAWEFSSLQYLSISVYNCIGKSMQPCAGSTFSNVICYVQMSPCLQTPCPFLHFQQSHMQNSKLIWAKGSSEALQECNTREVQ